MYDFITIERSYACGGQAIATALSKKLNYRLYDHRVVVETCKRLDMPYNQIINMDEHVPVKTPFHIRKNKYLPLEDQIYNTETEIIRDAAKTPGAIFVGRCASAILKDKKCLRVFITADIDFRKDRALNVENVDPHDLDNVMHKIDVRRKKYFTTHADAAWGTPEYFDIVLNSGKLGVEACVNIIVSAANSDT